MSLDRFPMVEPSLHHNAMNGSHPTVPKRGGPRRHGVAAAVIPPSDDESDSAFEEAQSPEESTAAEPSRVFDMANPDRPYNMWPGGSIYLPFSLDNLPLTHAASPGPSGQLTTTYGALLPDGYEHDTTLPDRPWICPVRLCRRLYGAVLALGNHFQVPA